MFFFSREVFVNLENLLEMIEISVPSKYIAIAVMIFMPLKRKSQDFAIIGQNEILLPVLVAYAVNH